MRKTAHARMCPAVPTSHVAQQGECITRIADRYGFRDYRTIYENAANADLRSKRPNAHLLHPGDVVVIPDKAKKEEICPTGRSYTFQTPSLTRVLRLVLKDEEDNPLANMAYQLTCAGNVKSGSTDGDGKLEEEIPIRAEDAELECNGSTWSLKIGHLNPLEDAPDDGVSGCQARLRNLGYDPGPIDGKTGPRTEAAVRAFQVDYSLDVDGICGPQTRSKLKEVHGS
jgi:hypothetical protein